MYAKPSFSPDYFRFNVAQSGGNDSSCIGSRDSDILDILLCRITFAKIGHTTPWVIFIASHIYDDHIISCTIPSTHVGEDAASGTAELYM